MFMFRRTVAAGLFFLIFLSHITAVTAQEFVPASGNVRFGNVPLCALVLVNGQSQFSCDGQGSYDLLAPTDTGGQLTVQVFVDGFAPFRKDLSPQQAEGYVIQMQRSSNARFLNVSSVVGAAPQTGRALISGDVNSAGQPVCAMVLANGESMFSCDQSLGRFSLDVPLDAEGKVTLMVFAAGFQPYRIEKDGPRPASVARQERIKYMRYDFDNNGVVDGVSEYSYGADGRVAEVRYTYTDDGVADLLTYIVVPGVPDYVSHANSVHRYEYDAVGRIVRQTNDFSTEDDTQYDFYWNDEDLVTRQEFVATNGNGVDVRTSSTDIEYSNGLVTTFSGYEVDSDVFPGGRHFSGSVEYDVSLLPVSGKDMSDDGSVSWEHTHFWDEHGRLDKSTAKLTLNVAGEIVPTGGFSYQFGRQESGLAGRGRHTLLVGSVGGSGRNEFYWRFDDAEKLVEIEHQLGSAGEASEMVSVEWESGTCYSSLLWLRAGISRGGALTNVSRPYLGGTGYLPLDPCDTYLLPQLTHTPRGTLAP